jgi:hypothetical protein
MIAAAEHFDVGATGESRSHLNQNIAFLNRWNGHRLHFQALFAIEHCGHHHVVHFDLCGRTTIFNDCSLGCNARSIPAADFIQRNSMRNQEIHRHLPAEHQLRGLPLQVHRGAVRSAQCALTHADICSRNFHPLLMRRLREQKYATPWTGNSHRLFDNTAGRSSDNDKIRTAIAGCARIRCSKLLSRGSNASSAPTRTASCLRSGERVSSEDSPPVRFTSIVNINPIGPWPRMATVSFGCGST